MIFIIESIASDSDREFMHVLYIRSNRLVRKTIFSITHDSRSLDDLVQDTYEKLIESLTTIRTLECHKLITYVVSTCKTTSLNFIRHRNVVTKHIMYGVEEDVAENLHVPEDEYEEQAILRMDVESLLGGISKLSKAYKEILYFRYYLDMSDNEIATTLGTSPQNVRQKLHRARNAAKAQAEKGCVNAK